MSINTSAISKFLVPGINSAFGKYDDYPTEYKQVYKTYQSKRNWEQDVEYRGPGLAAIKPQGAPIAIDDQMGTRTVTTYNHRAVGLMIQVTKEAIEDNLYKSQFNMDTQTLKRSMIVTKEILAMDLFNNAFDTAYPLGDGLPLCSASHLIDGGTYANMPSTAVDFNESAIESALINIARLKDAAGLPIKIIGEKAMIPPTLQFTATRVLKSEYRPMTANNDVNALNYMNALKDGFTVNHYLNSTTAWFILTNAPDGFKHFQRTPIDSMVFTDTATRNVMISVVERYSFGCSNPRAVYGSAGTSS